MLKLLPGQSPHYDKNFRRDLTMKIMNITCKSNRRHNAKKSRQNILACYILLTSLTAAVQHIDLSANSQ